MFKENSRFQRDSSSIFAPYMFSPNLSRSAVKSCVCVMMMMMLSLQTNFSLLSPHYYSFLSSTGQSWWAAAHPEGLFCVPGLTFVDLVPPLHQMYKQAPRFPPPFDRDDAGMQTCESKLRIMDGFSETPPCDEAPPVCVLTQIRREGEHQVALWGWAEFMAATPLRV